MELITQPDVLQHRDWIDFTSLSTFQYCPRRYWWAYRQGVQVREEHPALINGQAYHKAIATYHQSRGAGIPHQQSMLAAFEACQKIMKRITVEDKTRNMTVALETLHDYFTRWEAEMYSTQEVEVTGAIDLGDLLYVVRIDRIFSSPLGEGIMETKTTSIVGDRWQQRGKPNDQITGYLFAASVLGSKRTVGVLDVIPIHDQSSKRKPPFRVITYRSEEELAIWHRNVVEWWKLIKGCEATNWFPMHTGNCIPLIGASCPYHPLCSSHPDQPDTYELPEEFAVRHWNPLMEEEE
jgi:hypothetical protein